jgi:GT2 family glycosyltransferase
MASDSVIYLITVNYHSATWVATLLESVRSTASTDYTLLIVNNSPDDVAIHQLLGDDVVLLQSQQNLGFGAACNLALNWVYARSSEAIVWLINPDTVLMPGALTTAVKLMKQYPTLAIVGTTVIEPGGNIWFAKGNFNPIKGAITVDTQPQGDTDYVESDWVTGCSLLLSLSRFSQCPHFDAAYFLYYEDFDFCQRYASQGYAIFVTPKVVVTHVPSSIANRNLSFKFKHSTYSYLLTLHRYTNRLILWLRLGRIVMYAIGLILVKPQISSGKFQGIWMYFRQKIRSNEPTTR